MQPINFYFNKSEIVITDDKIQVFSTVVESGKIKRGRIKGVIRRSDILYCPSTTPIKTVISHLQYWIAEREKGEVTNAKYQPESP